MSILSDIWCRHGGECLYINRHVVETENPRIATRSDWREHLSAELMDAYAEYLDGAGIDPALSNYEAWADHAIDGMLTPATDWHRRNVRPLSDDY